MSPALRSGRLVLAAANAGLGAVCLLGVLRAGATLGLHVPFDLNEGWNAFHAADAMAGRPLYPPPDGFFFNNYPPLSFYLVGGLGLLTQDNILAGRLVSLIAFLATGFGIAAVARALGAGWKAGLFGALFFMAVLAFDTNRVGINDPQLLGHAMGMAGLWLALSGPRGAGRIAGAALLLCLAVFTKHNLVIQPVALALWLALTDRKAALGLAAWGLLFAAAGVGLFQLAYHRSIWAELVTPRLFSWDDSWNGVSGWLEVCGAPIAASLAVLRVRDRQALFCLVYLAASLAIGAWLEGMAGTESNVLFDNLIALGLCAALGWERLGRSARPFRPALLFAASFVLPVAGMLAVRAARDDFYPRYWLDRQDQAVRDAAADIALLRAAKDPVLCADLALCYWAGRTAELDEWGFNQAILNHRRAAGELAAAIGRGRYSVIVANPFYSAIWTGPVRSALAANYRLSRRDGLGAFWTRKAGG